MCQKLIVFVVSLCLISSAGADTINWDFENGNTHLFEFWSVYPPGVAIQDDTIAGDEELTGLGGSAGLPDNGVAWTVGPPDQFDGLIPAVAEGCHVVVATGLLEYGPCNDPFGYTGQTPNSRGQTGYLNTYNLSQWGDDLHSAANDQIATSPLVTLAEGAVLTVWSQGGGSGTQAPEYDTDPAMMYTDGSSGIVVWSADEADMYAILATIHTSGHGTLTEDSVDLSAFAGKQVRIDVVDAFQGGWGWLAVDEIQITNAVSKSAMFVVANTDLSAGFDEAQHDRLADMGYTVTVVETADLSEGSADGFNLLLISESIGSSGADPLIGTSTPIMHNEAYGWDNWYFMGPAANIIWATGDTVEIVNDTHEIAVNAGVSLGDLAFFDPQSDWTTELVSNIAPGAELIAQITAPDVEGVDAGYAIIFAIEEGAELANGTPATARTVGFSLPGQAQMTPEVMTDEAWALWDAAIAWLDPPPAPPSAAMIVSDPNLTAGFDLAQKDRLESLGYTVTVATGDDVSGGVFTPADAETFDVLVVSESIGSSAANNLIGANVPMMHQESYGWSRHFFTQGLGKTWLADAAGEVNIVDGTHQIVTDAGLAAGQVAFFTDPSIAWTTDTVESLVAGAVNVAQIPNADGVAHTIIFTIEAGTELADGSAAADRVCGFSLPGQSLLTADFMTDDAWALFDAAIAWLDQ